MKYIFLVLFLFDFCNFLQSSEALEKKLNDVQLKKLHQLRIKFERIIKTPQNNPVLKEVCGID